MSLTYFELNVVHSQKYLGHLLALPLDSSKNYQANKVISRLFSCGRLSQIWDINAITINFYYYYEKSSGNFVEIRKGKKNFFHNTKS